VRDPNQSFEALSIDRAYIANELNAPMSDAIKVGRNFVQAEEFERFQGFKPFLEDLIREYGIERAQRTVLNLHGAQLSENDKFDLLLMVLECFENGALGVMEMTPEELAVELWDLVGDYCEDQSGFLEVCEDLLKCEGTDP